MVEVSEARVGRHLYARADWLSCQCCSGPSPSTWYSRFDLFSSLCRSLELYREKVMFEDLDDHVLDDVGIDSEMIRRSRLNAYAIRRLSLVACGGF